METVQDFQGRFLRLRILLLECRLMYESERQTCIVLYIMRTFLLQTMSNNYWTVYLNFSKNILEYTWIILENFFELCAGTLAKMQQNFFLIDTWLNRTRYADHEYILFSWFLQSLYWNFFKYNSIRKKLKNWPARIKSEISPLSCHSSSLKPFYSNSASKSKYKKVDLIEL